MAVVDYQQLMLSGELLRRQASHARGISEYITSNCDISGHLGGGLSLLNVLAPISTAVVQIGSQASGLVANLSDAAADATTASLDSYVDADKRSYERFALLTAELGNSTPPFSDPREKTPTLGDSLSNAGSDYGDGSSNIFGKAQELGVSGADLVIGTISTAGNRISGWTESGYVVERSDPSSYLVPPELHENFAQDLRWSAGIILGGLDWIAEFFLGFSVLEEAVFKPFGGDWEHIKKASVAWSHTGQACLELSSNFSALPEQTMSWEGRASDEFRAAMAALAGAILGLSFACDYVSELVSQVGLCRHWRAALSALSSALLPTICWHWQLRRLYLWLVGPP